MQHYHLVARKGNRYAVGLAGISHMHLLYQGDRATAERYLEQLKAGLINPFDLRDHDWQDLDLDKIEGILEEPMGRMAQRLREAAERHHAERGKEKEL